MDDQRLQDKPKLALLIDADNVSAKYLTTILNEIPKYGIATYRRIYCDFTDSQAASWREKLLDNSILPVQQFSNIKSRKHGESAGKNATDSALIIDAMDILYEGKVDGFVIVSSDSDFTRLASRLRESGMIVVGMGRNQTAVSFRHACTKFVNVEYLYKLEGGKKESFEEEDAESEDNDSIETTMTQDDVEGVIAGIIRDNDNKGRDTSLAEIGSGLSNKFPDFDVRNFGYSQLNKLIEEMSRFELIKTPVGFNVRISDTTASQDAVITFIRDTVKAKGSNGIEISKLAPLVYDKFPHFDLKDAGYSQFHRFANSIDGIQVSGVTNKRARFVKKS